MRGSLRLLSSTQGARQLCPLMLRWRRRAGLSYDRILHENRSHTLRCDNGDAVHCTVLRRMLSTSPSPASNKCGDVNPFSSLVMHGAQSHLKLAHSLLHQVLREGDAAIDATCGNGHDSAFLAQRVFSAPAQPGEECRGSLYCIDVQESAIRASETTLSAVLSPEQMARVRLLRQSHVTFPAEIAPRSVRAVVYNLGYLPGSDKSVITRAEDTITSLRRALELVCVSGIVCVTCYRGHAGGAEETAAVASLARSLPPTTWSVYLHEPANRPSSPLVYTFYRNLS